MDDFRQTLDKFSVPAAEQSELRAIVQSTYGDIVVGTQPAESGAAPNRLPLVHRKRGDSMNLPKKLGTTLLGVWLIAHGAVILVPALTFQGIGYVLAALAIAAGVLLLLDR